MIDDVLTEALLETAVMPGYVGFPETILVDSNGIVRYHHFASYQSYNELRSEIEQWLPQVPPVTPPSPIEADGDLDGNGVTDSVDALMCLRGALNIIALTDDQIAHGDMDGDGSISSVDALIILRKALGILE